MVEVKIVISDEMAKALLKLAKRDDNNCYVALEIYKEPSLGIARQLSSLGLIDLHVDREVDGVWHYYAVINRAGDLVCKYIVTPP